MDAIELVVDNFAGAGGASRGIESALGRPVDIAINHSRKMVAMHKLNHPGTRHLCEDVWEVDPVQACAGRPVGLAWFSPDCKHFSKAKGGRPLSKRIRGLAWVVIRWAKAVRPRIIILENVEEFKTWGPLGTDDTPIKSKSGSTFRRWKTQLEGLGYVVDSRELVAADHGVPTTRRRFFLVARCDGRPIAWPARTHARRDKAESLGLHPWRPASDCIDFSLPCVSIFDRPRALADATMRRTARGVVRHVIEAEDPFVTSRSTLIQTGYGERPGQAPRVPGIDKPLGTVVGSACKHALVTAFLQQVQQAGHKYGCHDIAQAFPTVTAWPRGGGHALVAAHLTKLYGTSQAGQSIREPMPTITATGQHIGEVRAFLVKYYGSGGQDQSCLDPMHTITAKARLGLVTVAGHDYQIADIGLRMLKPSEYLRAQFGRFAAGYVLIGSQADQIEGIGNSVCPELAEAIAAANVAMDSCAKGIAS